MTTRSKTRTESKNEGMASPDDREQEVEDLIGSATRESPSALMITESQLAALIRGISGGNISTPPAPPPCGTFAKCSARFAGSLPRDPDVLEAFIDAVEVYKDCTNVSDEHALRGLPMLLTGEAAVWWQGVKATTTTWAAAIECLRGMFGAPRAPYKIFRDVFAAEQQDSERADVFVARTRAMLSKLPYNLEDHIQVDMCYGLLHKRVRKRLKREECVSTEGLLRRAREVEENIEELVNVSSKPVSKNSSHNNNMESLPSTSHADKVTIKPRQSRPKCSFCHIFGHVVSECRRLKDKEKEKSESSSKSDNSSALRCYGCGQLGVVRSRCTTCRAASNNNKAGDKQVDFHSFSEVNEPTSAPARPVVRVSAAGRAGVAMLDTGATHCIASPGLHHILLDAGVQFYESQRSVRLADGTRRVSRIFTGDTELELGGRDLPITFMVLPDAADARTLLGLDFITQAGIIVDAPQQVWYFSDSPSTKYDFVTYHLPSKNDDHSPSQNDELLALNNDQSVYLRDEEGTKLTSDQRSQLDQLLSKYADVFAADGPPTEYAMHCIKVKKGQQPIASPPYRMSAGKKEILEKELQKLLEQDIIEECESPWAANVVLVGKKDGGVRLCVDYRFTKKHAFKSSNNNIT
ncbi:uncharacterized protein [Maniola hyperantus]|uniref:uncharacterized protein n=1 Tax=Aphantopus hyperantus TaxID=2795564 RepID=UPI0015680B1A|nr:uncharacterized protein LOC117996427 [Maniola hyperantus]